MRGKDFFFTIATQYAINVSNWLRTPTMAMMAMTATFRDLGI